MAEKIVSSKAGKQNGGVVSSGHSSIGKTVVIPELEALAVEHANRMARLTDEQRAILRSYYGRVTIRAMADFMKVSVNKLSREVQALGLRR